MRDLDDIDRYFEMIDDEEVLGQGEGVSRYWTLQDHIYNLIHRTNILVKFIGLDSPPFFTIKQINLIRERLDELEEIIEDQADT